MSQVYGVAERFMRYVQIDTQSDPISTSFPSTEKQKDLGRLLLQELNELGLEEVEMDEHGYVFASIPSNTDKQVPVICFCSHMDTAPDCSGTNVKPILHKNYQGEDIILPDDTAQVIRLEDYPYLKERLGDDIITASGLTLLGADDKAGVAIIMDLAHYLTTHPEIKHGKIRVLFTPDEEVGRGVEKIDMKKVGASFGYTLDSGERGSIEGESFSADAAVVTFHGKSAHPGYAKGKMINAIRLAAEFVDMLPQDEWCPESTSGRQGFVHSTSIEGQMEKAVVKFIVRDFDTAMLAKHEDRLEKLAQAVIEKHPGARYEFAAMEQYRNMMDVLRDLPHVMDFAKEAIQRAGVTVKEDIIRGGTDGSRLSFMGLPCPNLFTGEMAIHSKHEYVFVQDMEKAVDTLVHLTQIWEEKS
ncbi:MAG TPA: peptidase T [Chitinophagaceae bacterium]|nr:peptidase T [Chitinophagaceae bacterium]